MIKNTKTPLLSILKYTLVLITLPLAGVVACASPQPDIFINPKASLNPYLLEPSKDDALTQDRLHEQYRQPFGFYIEVEDSQREETFTVDNCESFVSAKSAGHLPARDAEYTAFSNMAAHCRAADIIAAMTPAKTSALRDLNIDGDLIHTLPKTFAFFTSSSEQSRIMNNPDVVYWANATEVISTESVSPHELNVTVTGGKQVLTLLALGDATGNGYEDGVFLVHNSVEGGSYSNQKVFVVTRENADDPIEVVNM